MTKFRQKDLVTSCHVGSKKFILVMSAKLFNVSLRTFREEYIKGK